MRPTWFQILLLVCVTVQQIVGGASCCCFADQLLGGVRGFVTNCRDVEDAEGRSADESQKVVRACCRRMGGARVADEGDRDQETKTKFFGLDRVGVKQRGCDCDAVDFAMVAESEVSGRLSMRQDRSKDVFWTVVIGSIGLGVEWIRERPFFRERFQGSVCSVSSSQFCAMLNRWVC